jgi:hypothetical protein
MHDNARRRVARSLGIAIALTLGLALAGALFAGVVLADVPDPRNCIAEPVLVSAPSGGFAYHVTLRDGANQPVSGGTAILDFNPAPALLVCDDQDPDHDRRIVGTSNASGDIAFMVRVGGNGGVGTIEVITGGLVIATASVRTMDFDGDMDVDAADRTALSALVGTTGPAGDYDQNGTVNAADLAILDSRVGGNCTLLDALPTTWGIIKHRYR